MFYSLFWNMDSFPNLQLKTNEVFYVSVSLYVLMSSHHESNLVLNWKPVTYLRTNLNF